MVKRLKKNERGMVTNYVTRKAALRKLQLSLKDFRRLCILKGIHPHEPKHKKKINKGSTEIKTWYFAKDIAFLVHEPIIQKFRDYKAFIEAANPNLHLPTYQSEQLTKNVFLRKLKKANDKKEGASARRLVENKPKYKLDHIVRERYPTMVDAIRDLDDGLCLLFLFSRLPKSLKVQADTVKLCRRLTVEFLHYVIEARALRKVFVSIKGIYFQAEIMGQIVTWITPHERGFPAVTEVDFQVMATFVEFYTTALGFVNFRLFRELGLQYPPQLVQCKAGDKDSLEADTEALQERLYSLSESVKKESGTVPNNQIIEPMPDQFPDNTEDSDLQQQSEQLIKLDLERQRLRSLFEKCKIFLSRETPRESLAFTIRCCGGTVSWDSTVAYGSTFPESDETITHHVVDRPEICGKQYLSRRYIQPQWIFDCLNAKKLLPVDNYLPGATLPPHLSPFVQESASDYVPPEKIALMEQDGHDVSGMITADKTAINDEEPTSEGDSGLEMDQPEVKPKKASKKHALVAEGTVRQEKEHTKREEKSEHKKMREMMIPKKQRRVYQKILKKKKHVSKEALALKEKREQFDRRKKKATK